MQLIISVPFSVNMVYYSFRKHCCLTQFITVFVKYWLIDCILSRLLKTTGKKLEKQTNIKLYILNYRLRINKAKITCVDCQITHDWHGFALRC